MRRTLLAAALVLVAGCSSSPRLTRVDPSPRPDPVVGGDPLQHCADPAEPAPSLPLPEDAVAGRICEDGRAHFAWQPPQELLTEEIDGLLAVIAAQPPVADPDRHCTQQGGTGFDIRLEYPDDEVLSVFGDTGGCGELEVDGQRYEGAQAVLDGFLDRIEDQRTTATPSFERVRLGCGGSERGPRLSLVGEPRTLVRAISCWRENADELGPFHSSRISGSQLRLLLEDLDRRSYRQRNLTQPACQSSDLYYWQNIVGQTEWGDLVQISGVCDEFRVDNRTFWNPGPTAQRVLDRLRRRND